MSELAEKVARLFESLDDVSAAERLMDEIYSEEVIFEDPVQQVIGLDAFKRMNRALMKKMKGLRVDLQGIVESEDALSVRWTMYFRMPLGRREVSLPGVSWLALGAGGKCVRHSDYWDFLGAMEQMVPMLKPIGALIRKISG